MIFKGFRNHAEVGGAKRENDSVAVHGMGTSNFLLVGVALADFDGTLWAQQS